MATDFTLPFGPFRDALRSVAGAIVACLTVSMVGSFVAILIIYWDISHFPASLAMLLLGGILHWVVVCLMLWGGLFLVLQCLGLHALIYGSRDPLFILGLMFTNQVFVSMVALVTLGKSQIEYHRPLIFFTLMALALWALHKNSQRRMQ